MKKFIVISHTHWDREWYFSLAEFRLKLVDLIDRFLMLLETEPDYIFHLDAQTIVLDDYLAVRPRNRALLEKYIRSGNLRIGPWYLQNDFYLTDGETTVRNLLYGTAQAAEFGGGSSAGYAPDQFGNISQMPQILRDFGIDNYIFGRGFKRIAADGTVEQTPAEFRWVGADGSSLLAINLKSWYNNAQRIPEDLSLAKLLLKLNESCFEGLNVSPYILLMNGVDHLEPQSDVLSVIARLRAEGIDIEQTGLDEYIALVRESVKGKELPVYRGALALGGDYDILKGCWSSRIYLKRLNVRAEDLLEHRLESLYSYLERSGLAGAYPAEELDYLWKLLLENAPHDSICGCAADAVHRHMEDRYERFSEMGQALLARGMKLAAAHTGHFLADPKNYSVTVFNGTEAAVRGVAEATVPFVLSDGVVTFSLVSETGEEIPFEVVSRKKELLDVFSPLNLPGVLDVESTTIRFVAEVPPFTARVFAVVPGGEGKPAELPDAVENEYYRIYVRDGEPVIVDKATSREFVGIFTLEDGADKGDAYVYRAPREAPVFVRPAYTGEEHGLAGELRLKFTYDCPAEYDFGADCRSARTVGQQAEFRLVLRRGERAIGLEYRLENRAKDHRIRLRIKFRGSRLFTDSPFDCAERFPHENCAVTDSDTHHASTFAEFCGEDGALALFPEGQHEIGLTENGIAITLLRATGVINRDKETFRPTGGARWNVPENQCLRTIEGRIGLRFGPSAAPAELYAAAKFFRTGFTVHADSFDPKKYSGGRFAVQSSKLEKLYYLPDRYPGREILHEPYFTCSSKEIAVTCEKGGKDGGTVVRLVNLSEREIRATVAARGELYLTDMSERTKTAAGERTEIVFGPKKIVTLLICEENHVS